MILEKSQNPAIMADQIQQLAGMIKGADEASEIDYDNTESGLTAENVQAAIDELAGITAVQSEASGIEYDHTDSGLTADDVQSAIDELATFNVLATSSGSKTYAQHIATLKAVWDTLTDTQKLKCKVRRNYVIYNLVVISSGQFSAISISGQNIYLSQLNISSESFEVINGSTYTDISSNTTEETFTLYI